MRRVWRGRGHAATYKVLDGMKRRGLVAFSPGEGNAVRVELTKLGQEIASEVLT